MRTIAFVGYETPDELEFKYSTVLPMLDNFFRRINYEWDEVHLIEDSVDRHLCQSIIEFYNKKHDFDLVLDIEQMEF